MFNSVRTNLRWTLTGFHPYLSEFAEPDRVRILTCHLKSLLEISNNILDMFDTNRDT